MKNLYFLFLLFACASCTAKAEPNISNSFVSDDANFKKDRNEINISTVSNPQELVVVYSTNAIPANSGRSKGSELENNYTDEKVVDLPNKVNHYSDSSAIGYDFSTNPNQFLGYRTHAMGETLDTSQWTVIHDITNDITIERANSEVLMRIKGFYQANNNSTDSSGITSTLGFFVNDMLVDVKPMFLDFSSACANKQFLVQGTASNLAQGTHKVKFAIRNIDAPLIPGLTVSYGKPNPSCKTASSYEAQISSTISVNQPNSF